MGGAAWSGDSDDHADQPPPESLVRRVSEPISYNAARLIWQRWPTV
jgi:hypothetical protein